jgi:tRNA dimethylallyltransferase
MEKKIPLLAVVGPTASGKTALAVELALRTGGEVISADSMQIYKEMDIGTAKPTLEEQKGVPHHLLDFLDISQSYSVAQYVEEARSCIQEIYQRGRLPILAGGTGLYVSSLINHVQFVQEHTDPQVREELQKRLEQEGVESLLEELRSYDPESAARLHPNNQKRILRAMEIYQTTGVTMTEHIQKSRLRPSPYRHCVIGLAYRDRDILYQRIDRRVDQMIKQGLLEEAKKVLSSPYSSTAMGAIGYKELAPWVRGECSLQEAIDHLKQSTRRYAKRQLTWFRREEWVQWIYVDECENFEDIVKKSLLTMEIAHIL